MFATNADTTVKFMGRLRFLMKEVQIFTFFVENHIIFS